MKHIIIASALALAVAGAARAESITERTGVNSILGVSPSTADFVTAAAISDMFEIQSSKIIKAKALPQRVSPIICSPTTARLPPNCRASSPTAR